MQNLFSYPIEVEALGAGLKKYQIKAKEKELLHLAEVLKIPAIKSCEAEIFLENSHKTHHLDVSGKIKAVITQTSVISLEDFDREYDFSFEMFFDTKATYKDIRDMEPEFDDDVPDILEQGKIDLGNIIIEQIALQLDDYPRKEGEVFSFVSEFDEETTQAQNPFNVLKKLKK